MKKVAVIGDGGWGTALSILLYSKDIDTILWSVSPEYAEVLNKKRENVKFLKGVTIPKKLKITSDDLFLEEVKYAVFAVPCKYLRDVASRFAGFGFERVISATKGIENGSLKRPSEILGEFFKKDIISVLSGPSISLEVAKNMPTTVVLASKDRLREEVRTLFTTDKFRVYSSTDIIGVEMGGALKNIIAIAAGISDGLGFGTNTKAAILTRGLSEITRLGVKMGGRKDTFSGLSGIGDLATTCISLHSRNRWLGAEIGKGKKISEILKKTEMVIEGMGTARSAFELSKKRGVEMPITQKVYEVLYEEKSPRDAVHELMTREPKDEDYG